MGGLQVMRMRGLRVGSLLIGCLLLTNLVVPVHAEPRYRQRIEHFDISSHVNSRREIWEAIRDWGPSQNLSSYIVGQAKPRIGYSYRLRQKGGRCRFETLDVSVGVVIRLPSWDLKGFAKPALQQYFGCILKTVTVHEQRHAQIAYEAGERIEARFRSELEGAQCSTFADRAKAIYHEVLEEHGRRQSDFDQRDYARRRYEKCNDEYEGPQVNLNSRPKPSRMAIQNVPQRRFDEPDADAEAAEVPRAARAMPQADSSRAEADEQQGQPAGFSLETTRTLLGSAGMMLVAAVAMLGMFAAFMWGAARYEKRRELDAFAGAGDDGQATRGEAAQQHRTSMERSAEARSPGGGRAGGSFGKRNRR
jgi:predicted secreted Zn-dependent protease